MSTALRQPLPLTKRQRLESEIFDKSLHDIEKLFKELTGPVLKHHALPPATRHHHHRPQPSSLFDRPAAPQRGSPTQTKHKNYTYKHSSSYTSLFSHGKSKTRETSVEGHVVGATDHAAPAAAECQPLKKKPRIHEPSHSRHDLLRVVPVSMEAQPRDTALTMEAMELLENKSWSLWRSEVMGMIDYYVDDLITLEDVQCLGVDGFEETVGAIFLLNK